MSYCGERGLHAVERILRKPWLVAVCALGLSASGALAQAPTPAAPPPVRSAVDANGVDMISHTMSIPETPLSIGEPGASRMVYVRRAARGGQASNLDGYIDLVVGDYATRVVVGEKAEIFSTPTSGGNTYTAQGGSASTLTYDYLTRLWTYRRGDGVVATFSADKRDGKVGNWGPDGSGLITSVSYPDGEVITYHYKDYYPGQEIQFSQLQSVTNNLGYQIKFDYSSTVSLRVDRVRVINNAVEYCDPVADSCATSVNWPSITYTYNGNTIVSTDALQRATSVTTNYTAPGGRPTSLVVQRSGLGPVTYTFDPATNLPAGFVTSVTNGAGTWSYSRTQAVTTQTSTVVDPLSNSKVVVSDYAAAVVLSARDGLNRTTSYEYANYLYDRPSKETGPEGDYVSYTYDSRRNLVETRRVAKPGSGLADIVTSASYDAVCANPVTCNKPNYTIDERGGRTDYSYDPVHGGVTKVIQPPPAAGKVRPEVRYSYGQFAAQIKNAGGALVAAPPVWKLTGTSSCYALAGTACVGTTGETRSIIAYAHNNLLPTAKTTGRGDNSISANATTTYTYDDIGNVLTEDGPLGSADITRYHYDAMRQLVGIVGPDPDGVGIRKRAATRYTYNGMGQQTLAENGSIVSFTDAGWPAFTPAEALLTSYDTLGRRIQTAQISGAVALTATGYAYDNANRLICSAVRMNPGVLGSLPSPCLLSTIGADGADRISLFSYNAADELIAETSASGTPLQQSTKTSAFWPSSLPQTLADAKGNLTTIEYDGFNRVSKIRYPTASNGTASSTTDVETFQYDAATNLTQETRRGGHAVVNQYDALNRLTSNSDGVVYTYDNFGRMTSAAKAGHTVSRTYDGLDRVISEVAPTGTVQYKYDSASNLTRIVWPDGNYAVYIYDIASQLTSVRENQSSTGPGVLATFAYDDLGRRTSLTRGNGVVTTYTYDLASRLATLTQNLAGSANDQMISLTRNLAGQITSRTSNNDVYARRASDHYAVDRPYTANGLNQLTTSGSQTTTHDVRGNLTADGALTYGYDTDNRLISAGAANFIFDPMDRLYEITGGATTRLAYAGEEIIAEYAGSGTLLRRYVPGPGVDEPLVWYEGTGLTDRRWLVADERGSIVAVTDGSGAALAINTYDEYGIPGDGNLGLFQYTGQPWLAGASLYHYRARAYSPRIGRFLQPDPIGYEGGMNLYAYVGNDPVNLTDPTGTTCFTLTGACPEASTEVGELVVMGIRRTVENFKAEVDRMQTCSVSCYTTEQLEQRGRYAEASARNAWMADIVLAAPMLFFEGPALLGAGVKASVTAASKSTRLVTSTGTKITGFTKHGINRAVGDGGKRAGTSTSAWRDALSNPKSVKAGIDSLGRPFEVYVGRNARVVVNPRTGEIISVNPLGSSGVR